MLPGWPSPAPADIERRRLDHLLSRGEGRLVRVIAPSGYGKTGLVARWASTDRRIVRWVDLERADDDPVVLFDTIRRALGGLFDISPPSVAHVRADDPYVKTLEEGLSAADRPEPFLLVLDDVHRIRSLGGQRLLQSIIERLPPSSTVVMAGRGHHDQGTIGRLRLAPGVVDVTVDDLALEVSESHRLLEAMGVDPTGPEVAELLGDLEGWPAGLRLAGNVLKAGGPARHANEHVELVDYLRGEWCGQLDDGDRVFLQEVAVLAPFSGEQCDDVLGRAGSSEMLRRLHRDEVVVLPLDQRDEWYRMHGLLRRWLAHELKRSDPGRWVEIHRNAARYWEQRGEIDRAAEHAAACGDLELLETIVTVHGGKYFTTGRDATVAKWMEAFTPEHVHSSPGLSGLQCIQSLHLGDELRAVEWLRVLDRSVVAAGGPGVDPVTWWARVLHAALDERPAAETIPVVAAARQHLAGGPWSSFACWVHGALCFLAGELDECRDHLRTAVFEAEVAGNPLVAAHALAARSIVDDCLGDERSAEASAEAAAAAIAASGGELLPPTAPAMAVAALRHARRGDREAAASSIVASRWALESFRSIAPWLNVTARLALVRTALVLDDRLTARELIQELDHHARFEPAPCDASGYSAIASLAQLRKQVEAMHVPATGASALTDAELRVLHLLPTNLSLADIGAELFVSRNTVKSHAASIYRKLDATRRADAVEQARVSGLLPGAPTE